MKKFNYGAKGWGIVIFCFFLFWVGSGCPVTSLNVIMSEYNAMYGWDIAVLNGFGTNGKHFINYCSSCIWLMV